MSWKIKLIDVGLSLFMTWWQGRKEKKDAGKQSDKVEKGQVEVVVPPEGPQV